MKPASSPHDAIMWNISPCCERASFHAYALRGCGRGRGTVGVVVVRLKGFCEDSERLIEKVCCTAQCDGNLLESLLPSLFLAEGLKTAKMFIHDRLFRIEH
jgi:hypothetical protein